MSITPKNNGEARTERHEHHTHQEKSRAEWALEIAIGLMVFGTLCATSVAAYWTSQQWTAADAQLRTMQDTEKRQLRAYIGIVASPTIDKDPTKQSISFKLFNYGLTPAKSVTGNVTLQPVDVPAQEIPRDFPFKENPAVAVRSIFQYPRQIFPQNSDTLRYDLDSSEVREFEKAELGTRVVFIFGHFEYFEQGLGLLHSLPESPVRNGREIECNGSSGGGWVEARAGQALLRKLIIADHLTDALATALHLLRPIPASTEQALRCGPPGA